MSQNYQHLAEHILSLVGGKENVTKATHCATRLRLFVADDSKVNMDALDQLERYY